MPITHAFNCAIADDPTATAAGEVLPSHWNASHSVDYLTLTHGTITAAQPTFDASVTWNNAGVTFTGLKYDVTDTASAAGSLLVDWRVGGTSKFSVKKDGSVTAAGKFLGPSGDYTTPGIAFSSKTNSGLFWDNSVSMLGLAYNGSRMFYATTTSTVWWDASFGFLSSTGSLAWAAGDTKIVREGTGILAQRHDGSAADQTHRIYGPYTDASNYVRLSLSSSTTAVRVAAETAGTGADNIDVNITPAGTGGVIVGAFHQEFAEMTAPAAPAANGVRIYAQDNGGGKTQLMAIFSSGAAQQLAIQP